MTYKEKISLQLFGTVDYHLVTSQLANSDPLVREFNRLIEKGPKTWNQ